MGYNEVVSEISRKKWKQEKILMYYWKFFLFVFLCTFWSRCPESSKSERAQGLKDFPSITCLLGSINNSERQKLSKLFLVSNTKKKSLEYLKMSNKTSLCYNKQRSSGNMSFFIFQVKYILFLVSCWWASAFPLGHKDNMKNSFSSKHSPLFSILLFLSDTFEK